MFLHAVTLQDLIGAKVIITLKHENQLNEETTE
jgi:hypothetical protein